MRVIPFIFLFIFSLTLKAEGWREEAFQIVPDYSHPIEDSMIATVWGSIVKKEYVFLPEDKPKIKVKKIKSSYFKKGYLEYQYGDSISQEKKAKPLIIYNTGAFAELVSNHSKEIIRRFTRLGYRVVSFANPLNKEFIELMPKFELLDLLGQAKAYYYAIKDIHKELKAKNLVTDDVQVVGLSYGGLLSSVLYYYDSVQKEPLFSQGITAVSPPFDLINSLKKLDIIVEETMDHPVADSYSYAAYATAQIRFLDTDEEIDPELHDRAKALLGHVVFKRSLIESLKSFADTYDKDFIPSNIFEYSKWREEMDFSKAFKLLSPKTYEQLAKSPKRKLYHWLNNAKKNGHNKIRIVSAEDDVINDGIDTRFLGTEHLIELQRGGHYGFTSLFWFDLLLLKQFKRTTL